MTNRCTAIEYRTRTDKVTLQWSVARSVARRRKPQGKGRWSWDTAWKSGRACLGWRGNAPAKGQAGAVGFDACQIRQERKGPSKADVVNKASSRLNWLNANPY